MKQERFAHKVVLVTGGTGSIGSEIVRQLLASPAAQIRIYSRDEHKQYELQHSLPSDSRLRFLVGDIRDRERLDMAFRDVDVCFHAAALKHVPSCEYNPFEAVKTNIVGTQNIIDLALKHNLEKMVAVSTDKAVDPSSVLGASKLMMEKLVTAANALVGPNRTRFASVRFGNVLDSRGSVLFRWKSQIESGGPVTVTDRKATRFFMDIPEAVNLIFSAYELMQGGEVFVLKMKRKYKIIDLANETIARYAQGKKIPITIIGLRPGEKLHETLLTDDEARHTVEAKGMFIIVPEFIGFEDNRGRSLPYPGVKKIRRGSYTSG